MHPDDFVKLGPVTVCIPGIGSVEIEEAHEVTEEDYKREREIHTLLVVTSYKDTMEWVASLRCITYLKITGSWQVAMRFCPNKRIVHLMKHGKNDRVKLKNYKRAWREIKRSR